MPMSNEERTYLLVRNVLAEHKNKDKAVKELAGRGIKRERAVVLVDEVYAANKAENRKYAVPKMVLSGIGFLVLLGVFLGSGRLFVIGLPVCAFGFLWGLANIFLSDGYDIPTDLDDSD